MYAWAASRSVANEPSHRTWPSARICAYQGFFFSLVAGNALVMRVLVVAVGWAVGGVLAVGADPQVCPAIVELIAVDVVGHHALGGLQQLLVHSK